MLTDNEINYNMPHNKTFKKYHTHAYQIHINTYTRLVLKHQLRNH